MSMCRSHTRIFAFAAGALCAIASPFAQRAHADMQNVTFYGGSAFLKESHRNEGPHMVGLWDVEIRRAMQFKNSWNQICDYQARVKITVPQGTVFDDSSSLHEGCNANGVP